MEALEQFDVDWKDKYPAIAEQWRRHWDHLITMFNYPKDIRRVIYATNAIESVWKGVRTESWTKLALRGSSYVS